MEDWISEAANIGVDLSPAQITQFESYLKLILLWNQRINLTAVREPDHIKYRHFLDSLTCSLAIKLPRGAEFSLIDVGSGAGFPGIPLKIIFPNSRLVLVESKEKKGRFLSEVISELGLKNVEITTERVEIIGQLPEYRERFDWAVARAVAELRVLAEYLLPLCKIGGHILAQKGPSAGDEAKIAQNSVDTLGGGLPILMPLRLPGREKDHYLVMIEKIRITPQKFPRRPGMPGKRPL